MKFKCWIGIEATAMVCHHRAATIAIATGTVIFFVVSMISSFRIAAVMFIFRMMLISIATCFHRCLFLMFRTSNSMLRTHQGN